MAGLSSLRARMGPKAFGVVILIMTASLAAVVAHLAIDEAGDFLLRVDTYDHIVHHSRFLALLCAIILSASSIVALLAAALKDARSYRGELRALVGSHANRSPWRLILLVAPMSLLALLSMESLDAWLSSGHLPTFAGALGGSIPLGLAITASAAAAMATALWRALALLVARHRTITAALERFLTQSETAAASSAHALVAAVPDRPLSKNSVLANRAGKRAPPLPA